MSLTCGVCGAKWDDGTSVCRICGNELSQKQDSLENVSNESAETVLPNNADEVVHIENVEILKKNDYSGYSDDIIESQDEYPDTAKPLLLIANKLKERIESLLYSSPAFVEYIKAQVPIEELRPVFTDEQLKRIKEGSLKLLNKKNGDMIGTLVDPKTGDFVANVVLEPTQMTPEIGEALVDFSAQMQMAQVSIQIEEIREVIEEIKQGLEYDRLATAKSCEQKLLQAMSIRDKTLRTNALMRLVSDAEDSRNILMLAQSHNIDLLMNEPQDFWGKLFSKTSTKEIDDRIRTIRTSLDAVNRVSMTQAIAYYELNESDAAIESIKYFRDFLQKTYINQENLLRRLDLLDPANDYWQSKIPSLADSIQSIPLSVDIDMTLKMADIETSVDVDKELELVDAVL